MSPDVFALFRELADRSADERAEYYTRRQIPAALRAEVESLLRCGDAVTVEPRDTGSDGAVEQHSVLGPALLAVGTVFGPYQIVATLGRGGMGVVYAAEEIDSGRRIALKVLTTRAPDLRERERFEREGRIAASLNHPHAVFVFGASEIDGHLAIAMEIMRETLADRLKNEGPLPSGVAVDAVLQVIAGLQAGAAAGILHRDIKPSNCFVDAQGVVKIGDFGISRAERPTEETALSTRGECAATPAYASPEQLRGAELDVRADIYSVCATLYQLLTGHPPFDAANVMALLMAVANDAPRAPHEIAPDIPKGLSAVLLRGLAKLPAQRFPNYDALAAALEPYSSSAPTAATLGRRSLAGVIDAIPFVLISEPIGVLWALPWNAVAPLLTLCIVEIVYFVICESAWAATLGKASCGLMVVQQRGGSARLGQALLRASIYVMVPALSVVALSSVSVSLAESQQFILGVGSVRFPGDAAGRLSATPESLHVQTSLANAVMLLLLFSTARRRNGYAAVHDLLSRTRVVERYVRARQLPLPPALMQPANVVRRLGAFAVLGDSVPGLPDGWRPGVDERLRRPVWIREVPPGTPPVSAARRSINRATRLRWLAGRRTDQEAWDVFDGAQGVPLARAVLQPRRWQDAGPWLVDLARECRAHSAEDQPPRRLDRVWILDSGAAKLIDDPAHDQIAIGAEPNTAAAEFVLHAARVARGGQSSATPWPRSVHHFLERLAAEPEMDVELIANTTASLMRRRPAVTRDWRLVTLVVPLILPVLWVLARLAQTTAGSWSQLSAVILTSVLAGLFVVAATSLASAIVWRGGVMRLLGLELVTTAGRPASRGRVFVRTAVTWSPLLFPALVALWGKATTEATVSAASALTGGGVLTIATVSIVLLLAGAVFAINSPARGIQDRFAGTWIVPR